MHRNRILAGVAAFALIAAATGGWRWFSHRQEAPTEQEAAPEGGLSQQQMARLEIRTEAAQATSSFEIGRVPATITLPPESRVAVTAPFGGTVVRLFVVNGQSVTRGQPLAIVKAIESVQYGAALARAQAQLGVARAHAERTGQLAREGIIAPARAEEAQAALRQAEVDVSSNQRILAQSGASGGEVTLRAPITGRLAAVNIQTGGPVDGLSAPFVVENVASFMLDLQIPERLAANVQPGTGVSVPGLGGATIAGQIISIGASLDPATRSIPAKARLEGGAGLVSGKSVMAVLKGAQQVQGVSVPAAAMTQLDGKTIVFVAGPKGFAVRPVTVAGGDGARATIAQGLALGERVATSGISELKAMQGGN